jgi:hypothetical protein
MKRVWMLIGIILLLGCVLFEEKHRAATAQKHLAPSGLTDPPAPFPAEDPFKASNFSDQVDLWGEPWVKTPTADLNDAGLNFLNGLKPASFEKFQSRLDYKTEPVVTVLDREVACALFELGGFKLSLNLKPAYPNPEALLPSRIDPAIRGSFSF